MPDFKEKVYVKDAQGINETMLALCVWAEWDVGEPRAIWFPKSQVDDDSEVWEKGQTGEFVCSEWVAKEKKLI